MTRTSLCFAAAALFTVAAQCQGAQFQITPFLSCIDVDSSAQTITAYFGYESFELAVTQVVAGIDNRFLPPPANRNQPILFFPGYHDKAFRVTYASGILLWVFNGSFVTVEPSSKTCTPLLPLPSGVAFVPYSQKLAAIGNRAALTWQAVAALPAGLSLSVDGILSGTPTAPGVYTLGVNASDGITTTPTVHYQLTIEQNLSISDALSTRPPGFTPQFRTVTQTGVSNNAIAFCDVTEFVVAGGGSCVVPNQNTIQGRVASSQISGNAWAVTCSGGTATAMAVCSQK